MVFSFVEAKRSRKDLITERRLNFELGLLAEMSRQHAITRESHLHGYLRALFHGHADATELPVARAVTGVHASEGCSARLQAVKEGATERNEISQAINAEVGREIEADIGRRMRRR